MRLERSNFKLAFIGEPEFHETVSGKTGKHVTTCTLEALIKTPSMEDSEVLELLQWGYSNRVVRCTGKAVCTDGDEHNTAVGRAVAQAKAETKCYNKAVRMLKKNFNEGLDILVKALDEFEAKAKGIESHNGDFIGAVTNPITELHKKITK